MFYTLNGEKKKLDNKRDKKGRFVKGFNPWNKGIKIDRKKFPRMGHFSKHSEISKQKNREKHLGKTSWNKNISHTEEHKKNLSLSWDYNKHIGGIENLRKLSKMRKGFTNIEMFGKKASEERIRKFLEKRKNWKIPFKDSTIEIKIQNFLSKLHIEYFIHKYISEITHSYQCDIFIPKQNRINQKIIIECDGCYWHSCPICDKNKGKKLKKFQVEHIIRDKLRTKELQEKGFRVIRIWEHEIKVMELNGFENKIKNAPL